MPQTFYDFIVCEEYLLSTKTVNWFQNAFFCKFIFDIIRLIFYFWRNTIKPDKLFQIRFFLVFRRRKPLALHVNYNDFRSLQGTNRLQWQWLSMSGCELYSSSQPKVYQPSWDIFWNLAMILKISRHHSVHIMNVCDKINYPQSTIKWRERRNYHCVLHSSFTCNFLTKRKLFLNVVTAVSRPKIQPKNWSIVCLNSMDFVVTNSSRRVRPIQYFSKPEHPKKVHELLIIVCQVCVLS